MPVSTKSCVPEWYASLSLKAMLVMVIMVCFFTSVDSNLSPWMERRIVSFLRSQTAEFRNRSLCRRCLGFDSVQIPNDKAAASAGLERWCSLCRHAPSSLAECKQRLIYTEDSSESTSFCLQLSLLYSTAVIALYTSTIMNHAATINVDVLAELRYKSLVHYKASLRECSKDWSILITEAEK
jgi:hypothetical protein